MNTFSRRGFLRRAATMGAAGTLGLASIAGADEAAGGAPADTVAWDGVYDVVIAGMGAAGCSAAIYAAKAGAEVLLFDVAPEWEAGGNSRYCGQFVCIGHDKDMLMDYYRATHGEFPYDEAVIDALTDGQLELTKWAVEDFGCAEDELVSWKEQGLGKAEFPEHPGSDTIDMFTVGNVFSSSKLFKNSRGACTTATPSTSGSMPAAPSSSRTPRPRLSWAFRSRRTERCARSPRATA